MKHTGLLMGALALAFASHASAQNPADRPLPSPIPVSNPKAAAVKPAATQAAAAKSTTDRELQPLPEPPPPPPGLELDPALEPQVTIQRRGTETVEEFRIQGRLYMIKVTPAHGVPYYLIDEGGQGDFVRRDSFDTRTRPPMWVIHQW
jgi:hypothetical protein